jgi:hypothetical protein
MIRHQLVRGALYDYLMRNLAPAEREEIERHLDTCAACRDDLAVLREALALIPRPDDDPAGERSQEFWETFAYRLERRISSRPAPRWQSAYRSFLDSVLSFAVMRKGQIALAGVASALAVLAFALFLRPQANRTPVLPSQAQVSAEPSPQPATRPDVPETKGIAVPKETIPASPSSRFVDNRVSDYFRKSKILLIGISNLRNDPETIPDLRTEGRVSRDLVKEARYLRNDRKLDPRARALIEELNRVLIQLASLAERSDASGIEIVRGGIRQENLLFKIRMAETAMDVSHRSSNAVPKEASPL